MNPLDAVAGRNGFMKVIRQLIYCFGLAAVMLGALSGRALAVEPPSFQEVLSLVRSNLAGATPVELDRAVLEGFLDQLQGQVMLVTNTTAAAEGETNAPLVSVSRVFDDSFAYVRFSRVESQAVTALTNVLATLSSTNKLRGLVLDLRFARGQEYDVAAAVADQFMSEAKPILEIGDKTYSSTAKTNNIALPLTVLVNRQTSGSAEALASLLRRNKAGLVLGSATAGEAIIYKDFPLSTGQQLRVAISRVKLGEGPALSLKGVKPDITIAVDADDEKAYFKDAYVVLPKTLAQIPKDNGTNSVAGVTNRPPRRMINEAELVRMHREGQNTDEDTTTAPRAAVEAEKPVVRDPVLGRALDLLKGLAVVKEYRAF